MSLQQWENTSGQLATLKYRNGRYGNVPLTTKTERDRQSLMDLFTKSMDKKQRSLLDNSKLNVRQLKFSSGNLVAITAEGDVIGEAGPFSGMFNFFPVGVIDDRRDEADYNFLLGSLYITNNGNGFLVKSGDDTGINVPYSLVKCQREFGLTKDGQLVHFNEGQTTYQPGLFGDGETVIDFAVTFDQGDFIRNIIVVSNAGDVSWVVCYLKQGVAEITSASKLPYKNIVSVYSHWNSHFIIMLDRQGDVIVHNVLLGREQENLALRQRNIIALSEPGAFPLLKGELDDKDGQIVAAAYTASSAFVLRNLDIQAWKEIRRYKSLCTSAADSNTLLFGIAY